MAESGSLQTPALQGWQRANLMAAANCLREQLAHAPDDQRLSAAYTGLLDILDPSRLLARKQREQAAAARQAPPALRHERRTQERRVLADRRAANPGTPASERRRAERRVTKDRRRA